MREPILFLSRSPAVYVCLWMPFFEVMREEDGKREYTYTFGNIAAVKLDISTMPQLLGLFRIWVGSESGLWIWRAFRVWEMCLNFQCTFSSVRN